ncbi:MAG: hypothetical protein K2W91_12800 [Novosphingobium sp.]|nr:hypothetical protein [Novosphingobium sp.]
MRRRALFGLAALLPAALNLSAPASGALMMPLCSGDGQVRMVEVPGAPKAPAGGTKGCCAKGCHSSSNRKRAGRNFEPAQ